VGPAKAGVTAIALDHPADEGVAKVGDLPLEERVLLQAGARAVYRQAGLRARSGVEAIAGPGREERSGLGPRASQLLTQTWDQKATPVLYVLLGEMRQANRLLPAELIPRALSESNRDLRKACEPLLGSRGEWLRELNPEWSDAEASAEMSPKRLEEILAHWDEASSEDQAHALRTLRASDPVRGRELVAASLPTANAEGRNRLVAALRRGLSIEDEALLEKCLDDRSENVRRTAAELLSDIPESAYRRRMLARAEPLLTVERRGLIKKKLHLVVTPPKELTPEDIRDGMPQKAPAKGGQRAMWLQWIMQRVPPAFFLTKLDLRPEELVTAVAESDYAGDILSAWLTGRDPETPAEWTEALLRHWLHSEISPAYTTLRDMMARIPRPAAESIVEQLLFDDGASRHRGYLSEMSMLLLPPWSEQFSRVFLKKLAGHKQWFDSKNDGLLSEVLSAAQAGIAINVLPEVRAFVAREAAPGKSISDRLRAAIELLEERIQLRHEFQTSLTSEP
jgi:hypothetical protein